MKSIDAGQTSRKTVLAVALALPALSVAPHAFADSLLFAQTTLVNGSLSTTDEFQVASAGKVTVDIQSLAWPAALNSLSFLATSADSVLASWNGSGLTGNVATFDVAPGTYFAHIMGQAGGALNLGLYSLTMTFSPSTSPVPLPASGWMLLIGMFGLAGLAWAARPTELMGTAET